ncbi:chemoreceptor glutamine deamidase CheD [Clostridium puniceum]|uniref:Chemoreceptor glutamine deamidase CheD n=1 Tax=Clostridium puniceum TaxID=29367 RepID=A0A1S8TEI8_9CLOT|nr:chemotaxis protein CheD [Clostridium puniceum]OOM76138.1 chemoreceptor glutamine deamidase CheD [Clostridium puniceum]
MEYVVGIGEYIISANQKDVVKTFALSTCVGIVIYDVNKKILAMAHVLLPKSINGKEAYSYNSAKYADTAVFNMVRDMKRKYKCNMYDLKASLFGGIDSEVKDYFKVGEKNLAVIKEILNKMNIRYDSANTGGRISRTLIAYTGTGDIEVKTMAIPNNMK